MSGMTFPRVLIAVPSFGTEVLLDGPTKLRELMDGPFLDDNAFAGVPAGSRSGRRSRRRPSAPRFTPWCAARDFRGGTANSPLPAA